jgi:hypothetical protein
MGFLWYILARSVQMKYKSPQQMYLLTSNALMLMFALAFVYVIVVNIWSLNIPCENSLTPSHICPSCGLTRGVYQCLNFNFKIANNLNPDSLFFCFFGLSQIIIRLPLLIFLRNNIMVKKNQLAQLVIIDVAVLLLPLIYKII